MDLDDILTKADAYDTEASAQGTSLGGEGFLAQFAAIQDVKNDELSWDDIIPVTERANIMEEETRDAHVAEEPGTRKRTAVRTYEGMDYDETSPVGSPGIKSKQIVAPRKTNAEKALELKGMNLFCVVADNENETCVY